MAIMDNSNVCVFPNYIVVEEEKKWFAHIQLK